MKYYTTPPFQSTHLTTDPEPNQFIALRITTPTISREFVMVDSIGVSPDSYLDQSYVKAGDKDLTDLAFYMRVLNKTDEGLIFYFRTKQFGRFTIERFRPSEHESIVADVIYEDKGEQYHLNLTEDFVQRLTNPEGMTARWT
jgi:hypothetical protein